MRRHAAAHAAPGSRFGLPETGERLGLDRARRRNRVEPRFRRVAESLRFLFRGVGQARPLLVGRLDRTGIERVLDAGDMRGEAIARRVADPADADEALGVFHQTIEEAVCFGRRRGGEDRIGRGGKLLGKLAGGRDARGAGRLQVCELGLVDAVALQRGEIIGEGRAGLGLAQQAPGDDGGGFVAGMRGRDLRREMLGRDDLILLSGDLAAEIADLRGQG